MVKNSSANAGDSRVFLHGKFQRRRSLAGYSPRGRKESDTTEHTCTRAQGQNVAHAELRGDRCRV